MFADLLKLDQTRSDVSGVFASSCLAIFIMIAGQMRSDQPMGDPSMWGVVSISFVELLHACANV